MSGEFPADNVYRIYRPLVPNSETVTRWEKVRAEFAEPLYDLLDITEDAQHLMKPHEMEVCLFSKASIYGLYRALHTTAQPLAKVHIQKKLYQGMSATRDSRVPAELDTEIEMSAPIRVNRKEGHYTEL